MDNSVNKIVWDYKESVLDAIDTTRVEPSYGFHDNKKGKPHEIKIFRVIVPPFRPKHTPGGDIHTPEFELKWAFCPECAGIRYKLLIGYDNHTQTAHLRYFVKDGMRVQP